jgi:hypothetical protein
MLVSQATLDETAGPYLGAVIWCDTLLDLENDFCRLFSGLRLEVVALRFRGFVHDDLSPVSMVQELRSRYRAYLECGRMSPRDFASNHIAEMYRGRFALPFKHGLSARSGHDM